MSQCPGFVISWTTSSRYLGVYLESSVKFKCSFARTKLAFVRPSTTFLEKLDATHLFALIKSKCLPVLFYGTEACPITSADKHLLEFTMNKVLHKIFGDNVILLALSVPRTHMVKFVNILVLIR